MTTLKLFSAQNISVPASTSWYLADLGEFTVSQLEQACPGVSRDMIRRVLREQQGATSLNAKAVGLRHGGKRRCVPFSKGNKEGNRGQAQQNFSVR